MSPIVMVVVEREWVTERDILPMGCSRRIDPDETDGKGSGVISKVNQSMGERPG